MAHRVVVTGLGIVSAVGSGIDPFWHHLIAGRSGIRASSDLQTPTPVAIGAIDDLPAWPTAKGSRRPPDRMIQLAHAAVADLQRQQSLPADSALLWGTGYTAMGTIESCYEAWFLHDKVRGDTVPACMPTSVLASLCTTFGLRGMSTLVSASCASGLQAVGLAFELLRHGVIRSALVGASDAPLTPGMLRAWRPLRVLAPLATVPAATCCPFSPDRNGLVLAEGAGAMLLETLDHAQERQTTPIAEIIAFDATTSGGSIVAPNIDQQAHTVQRALDQAQLPPTAISYINAHATATRLGDSAETTTIKTVFGAHAHQLAISGIKGATGHAMGASSILEIIATVLALRDQQVPPTINWQPGDPDCDLDYVPNIARMQPIEYALKQSFGFGGSNAALILRHID